MPVPRNAVPMIGTNNRASLGQENLEPRRTERGLIMMQLAEASFENTKGRLEGCCAPFNRYFILDRSRRQPNKDANEKASKPFG